MAAQLGREDLRHFQNFFIEKQLQCFDPDPARRLPGIMLALEPGAGKTVTVLTGISDLLDAGHIRRSLVVAPLLVAQTVWPEEPAEWRHLTHLKPTLIRIEDDDPRLADFARPFQQAELLRAREQRLERFLPLPADLRVVLMRLIGAMPEQRAERARAAAVFRRRDELLTELLKTDSGIHVINKEALPWLWEHFGKGVRWPYDLMVIDDCREGRSGKHRVKRSDDDDRTAPLSRWGIMAAARKYMKATFQLTGTPTPKGLENMWGLIYVIDLGKRLLTSKTAFLRRWFFLLDKKTFRSAPKANAFDDIMAKVKDIMFSLDPKDMAELPDLIIDPIRVKLPEKVLKEYRRFERTLVSEEYDVEAVNGGVLHGKKLQFANGSMFREDGNDVWIHDCKIDALKELVERLGETPLLVAYDYEFDKQRILKAFPNMAEVLTPERAVDQVRRWNRDEIPLLLAHRAAAGHGLNMQKGTGHMCEYGLTTDAELYLQFIKRIRRPGRKTTVINHVIIAEGTIDDDVFPDYIDPKVENQNQVLLRVRVSIPSESLTDLLA